MNEQLQQALAVILDKSVDAISAGVSFLQAEIPDVIRQLLMWKLVSNSIIGAALCIAVGLWLWLGTRLARKLHKPSEGAVWVGYVPFTLCAFVFVLPAAFSRLLTALQIWIAPKIFLIEYAAKLVKGE